MNDLLHISFRSDLSGVLVPRPPAGSELEMQGEYPEPLTPRVCFSPTVEQCFQAVFANVSKFFEERNYPHMDFTVYRAVSLSNIGFVSNNEIVRNRYVWDAHVTGEAWATKPVRVMRVGTVRVFNTNKLPMFEIHPFNDTSLPKRGLAPEGISYSLNASSGSLRWAEEKVKK